jgi:hypothetical protein
VRGQLLLDRSSYKRSGFPCSELTDFDIIAREVSGYRTRLEAIEKRLDEVEKSERAAGRRCTHHRPSPWGDFRSLERGL